MSLSRPDAAPAKPILFHGSTGDYFPIWLKNTLLRLATLGIYGPWARANDRRYFWGATSLDGVGFERHDDGWKIFVGLLLSGLILGGGVMVLQFAVMFVSSTVPGQQESSALGGVAVGVSLLIPLFLLVALSYMYYKGLRYRCRVTSWRGLHFRFLGDWKGTALNLLIAPVMVNMFSMYLLAPLGSKISATYLVKNIEWAGRKVHPGDDMGKIWAGLGVGLLMGVVLVAPIAVLVGLIGAALGAGALFAADSMEKDQAFFMIILVAYGSMLLIFMPFAHIFLASFRVGVRNGVWHRAQLEGLAQLQCQLSPWRAAWIAGSSLYATLFTLGLARAWAKVRMWRFLVSGLSVVMLGDLAAAVASHQPEIDAIGDGPLDDAGIGGL